MNFKPIQERSYRLKLVGVLEEMCDHLKVNFVFDFKPPFLLGDIEQQYDQMKVNFVFGFKPSFLLGECEHHMTK